MEKSNKPKKFQQKTEQAFLNVFNNASRPQAEPYNEKNRRNPPFITSFALLAFSALFCIMGAIISEPIIIGMGLTATLILCFLLRNKTSMERTLNKGKYIMYALLLMWAICGALMILNSINNPHNGNRKRQTPETLNTGYFASL